MKTVIIDFDGTLCEHKFPDVGKPEPYVKEALEELKNMGYRIIIHSCRTSWNWGLFNAIGHIKAIKKFMRENSLPYDKILTNYTYNKPLADVYIDDRSIGYRGDWSKVIIELKNVKEYEI